MLQTPIGPVSVGTEAGADGEAVCAVRLGPPVPDSAAGARADPPGGLLGEAVAQLRAYFLGTRTGFALPLKLPVGGARPDVWAELSRIQYGEMRTYGEVAAAVGGISPRAVGTACNRNPLPLLVPCHRVVGAGGKLVGFGAGLPRKRWLLEHEAQVRMRQLWT